MTRLLFVPNMHQAADQWQQRRNRVEFAGNAVSRNGRRIDLVHPDAMRLQHCCAEGARVTVETHASVQIQIADLHRAND
jgi:hypothetical protein